MSYRQSSYQRPIWIPIVVIVLMLGWCVSRAPGPANSVARLQSPERVERELTQDPVAGEMYRVLRDAFPGEFAKLRDQVIAQAKDRFTEQQIAEGLLTSLIEASQRQMPFVAQAPGFELAAYRRSEIDLVRRLEMIDKNGCADFTMRGATRRMIPDAKLEKLALANRIAKLRAAAAGRDRPVRRPTYTPTMEDWRKIAGLMAAQGLSSDEVATFFDEIRMGGAQPSDQCRFGLAYLEAISRLPAADANRFYAALVAQATKAPGPTTTT